MPEVWVVVLGNPFDGLNIIGPFPNRDAAIEYGENIGEGDWWVIQVAAP